MDITSPINLWREYDVTTLPLNASALSQKSEDGICVKEYYYDGYTTVDGRVRAYVKILENAEAKGVVLLLPDADFAHSQETATTLYSCGYTVATLDYLGKTERRVRYTMYPKSLSDCNCDGITEFDLSSERKYTRWYIWTCLARRATYLLKELYGKAVFAIGIGLGGCTAYKLAAFDDGLTACATLLNIMPKVKGEGNAIINYRASLDNNAYASISKVPLFMAVTSNDEDGSVDSMSELADNTESLEFFRIVERAFSAGITEVLPSVDSFFTCKLSGGKAADRPEITASNSDGSLYLKITTPSEEGRENSSKLDLFVSFCVKDARYRNWISIPTIGLGDGVYIAQINVCDAEKPIYAFANTKDENAGQSSAIFSILPKTLGIKSKSGVAHRKIYDGSMGCDCWISRRGGKIELVQGPYGIDGITSEKHSLLTFKPGDPLFKVPSDTLLQIMATGKAQTLSIKVGDGVNFYSCDVNMSGEDDWHKFSLSHNNFKSTGGVLPDWSHILMIEFTSEEKFIIGSVLWV